jgi:RsiW-degrading membrane proteinase PrsW (M82 family)
MFQVVQLFIFYRAQEYKNKQEIILSCFIGRVIMLHVIMFIIIIDTYRIMNPNSIQTSIENSVLVHN